MQRIRIRAGGGDDGVRVDESLSDRVPTTIDGADGLDSVRLEGSDDSERLRVSAEGTRVRVARDTARQALELGGVEQVRAATLGGADIVRVDDMSGPSCRISASISAAPTPGATA